MDTPATAIKQPLANRLFFFVLGGALSSLLNAGVLWLAHKHLGWSQEIALGLSVVVTAMVFFAWSYFINFRTSTAWHNCFPRYIAVLVFCNILNYVITLSGIKKPGMSFLRTYLVIVAVYSFTGCVKFCLYHFWVFPRVKAQASS